MPVINHTGHGIESDTPHTAASPAPRISAGTLIVNRLDKRRLAPRLRNPAAYGPVSRLRMMLAEAIAVPPEQVPGDVVTMNSRIILRDPADDGRETYVLAYPNNADTAALSVLSPLGSALLAAREGERVVYMGAKCARDVIVERIVFQPERSGDYEL